MYQINPALIRAIAQVESDFNPSAVNHNPNNSYDTGLMQINSRWKKQLGNRLAASFRPLLQRDGRYMDTPAMHGPVWICLGCGSLLSHGERAF